MDNNDFVAKALELLEGDSLKDDKSDNESENLEEIPAEEFQEPTGDDIFADEAKSVSDDMAIPNEFSNDTDDGQNNAANDLPNDDCSLNTSEPVVEEPDVEESVVGESVEPSVSIDKKIDTANEMLSAIYTMIDRESSIRTKKDDLISSMNDELKKYRDGMFEKIFKPILMDIISLREDLRKTSKAYEEKDIESVPKEKLITLLEDYTLDIADLLEKYNVSIYESELGSEFIPIKQKIIKTIDGDEEQNAKIAKIISNGYILGEEVLSPERVYVYKK